jgi:hypothetical protein
VGLFSKDPDSDDDSDGEKSTFFEERGFIASAIVVGAVLICLVVWFMLGSGSDNPTANPSQTPSTVVPTGQPTEEETNQPPASPTALPTGTVPTPPPANSRDGGCHNKNPNQAIPRLAAPVAVSWQFEGKMLIPIQAANGPATTSPNGVRSCFSHSPTGAVLAAMVALGQLQNPEVGVATLRSRVYPGPGRDAAIAEARKATTTPSAMTGGLQFAAFKVLDYPTNATRAIIQIVADLNGKAYGAMPITMRWYRGDWYVELQDDGSFNGSLEPDILSSLSGYVRFSGAA